MTDLLTRLRHDDPEAAAGIERLPSKDALT